MINKTKICSKCKIEKNKNEFYSDKYTKDKLRNWCKICCLEQRQKPGYKEKVRIFNKRYYARNKDKVLARCKKYGCKYYLKAKFGLTEKDVENILEQQRHKCLICIRDFSDKLKPNIDHCHTTNKVRGILCKQCNLMLGNVKDNISILEKAILYLQESILDG